MSDNYLSNNQRVASSRVRDQGKGSEVSILLEISVESLTLKSIDSNSNAMSYVNTIMRFYDSVLHNRFNIFNELKKFLMMDYDLKALRPIRQVGTDGSLLLEVLIPRSRLVSIQCDHSSGRLGRELQKILVSENLLADLPVADITLIFEPRSL